MIMDKPHSDMSTPSAYEGVNIVPLRFVAQSFRQLLDQTLSAPSSIAVLFRPYYSVVLNLRHFRFGVGIWREAYQVDTGRYRPDRMPTLLADADSRRLHCDLSLLPT